MATKAHLEGNKRYLEKLDQCTLRLPGGSKDKIKAHAQSKGLSLNAYIVSLIEMDMGKLEG
jgi:predicted HicB family RNase H-like nuclease